MPTTTTAARKQYGLRWLFGVTALVCVLLAANHLAYETFSNGFNQKRRQIRINVTTQAEVEKLLGAPSYNLSGRESVVFRYHGCCGERWDIYYDAAGVVTAVKQVTAP